MKALLFSISILISGFSAFAEKGASAEERQTIEMTADSSDAAREKVKEACLTRNGTLVSGGIVSNSYKNGRFSGATYRGICKLQPIDLQPITITFERRLLLNPVHGHGPFHSYNEYGRKGIKANAEWKGNECLRDYIRFSTKLKDDPRFQSLMTEASNILGRLTSLEISNDDFEGIRFALSDSRYFSKQKDGFRKLVSGISCGKLDSEFEGLIQDLKNEVGKIRKELQDGNQVGDLLDSLSPKKNDGSTKPGSSPAGTTETPEGANSVVDTAQ